MQDNVIPESSILPRQNIDACVKEAKPRMLALKYVLNCVQRQSAVVASHTTDLVYSLRDNVLHSETAAFKRTESSALELWQFFLKTTDDLELRYFSEIKDKLAKRFLDIKDRMSITQSEKWLVLINYGEDLTCIDDPAIKEEILEGGRSRFIHSCHEVFEETSDIPSKQEL